MEAARDHATQYSSDEESMDSQPEEVIVILDCEGIPRPMWMTKVVDLHSLSGVHVAQGIYYSVSSDVVIGANGPLGDLHVAVQISKTLNHEVVLDEWRYSLQAWPIENVYLNGASLRDHELRAEYDHQQVSLQQWYSSRKRPYASVVRNPLIQTGAKAKELLTQQSINGVSSKVCCSKNCVQPFPREKIKAFRERMYRDTTFEFCYHMKLDVHRQVHRNGEGRNVVTVERIDVYLSAWRHIAGVSKSTFHRFQGYTAKGESTQPHGNAGTMKPRKHTLQATTTLECALEKEADHMLHRTHTLLSGEKVVYKVLPASFKWKDTIPEVNAANAVFGLKGVLVSNISRIRKRKFPEYNAKKPGDNFARSAKCDRYKTLRRTGILPLKQKWDRLMKKHLLIARAHRDHYYVNRLRSTLYPHKCLTIMHDKMDLAKTASPVFSHKSKQLDGLTKLPISVMGMIAHGHGDVRYAHYGLDIFFHDSNYTVGSIARLLRDIERP